MLDTVFAILILFLLISWIRWRKRQFSIFRDLGIPGPKPNFVSGNYEEIIRKGVGNCHKEWIEQYGKVLGYFRGGIPILLVADNELAKQILIKDFDNFIDRPSAFTATPVPQDEGVYSTRLVNLKGKKRWKELRNMITPALTTSKLKLMIPQINAATETFIKIVKEMSTTRKSFNIFEMYGRLALDITCRVVMGVKTDTQNNPNSKIHEAMSLCEILPLPRFLILANIYFPEFRKLWAYISKQILSFKKSTVPADILRELVKECMHYRRTSEKYHSKDVLQKMMDSHLSRFESFPSTNTNQEIIYLETEDMKLETTGTENMFHSAIRNKEENEILPMADNEIIDNAIMFFIGGFEPVRATLSFASHLLIHHPEIQKKLREEIWENVNEETDLDYNSVLKLTYLECFLVETLRMYPNLNGFITRIANEDVAYGPHIIKKGMIIQIAALYINRDPDIWQDPDTFNPDRFRTDNMNTKAILSFGTGPKHCLGERLALLQMKIILARMLYKYELIQAEDTEDEITITYDQISMAPKHGVNLKAIPVKRP